MSTRARNRWLVVYRAIFASRAMGSLIRCKTDSNDHSQSEISLLRSSSTTAATFEVDRPNISHHSSNEDSSQNILVPNVDDQAFMNMVKDKNLMTLSGLGGVKGVAFFLGTDPDTGIPENDEVIKKRRDIYGSNTWFKKPPKGFLFFVLDAVRDSTLLIILGLAALTLGFGDKAHGGWKGCYDGYGIFIVVLINLLASVFTKFHSLSKVDEDNKVTILRGGQQQIISNFDVVVGDVVLLSKGDQVPGDGLFLEGNSLQVDESSTTEENELNQIDSTRSPFLFSGSRVADGSAKMLVTSVGMKTMWGEMMSSMAFDSNQQTPLQANLDKLDSSIGKLGGATAFVSLLVMLVYYFTGYTKDENGKREYNGRKTDLLDVLVGVLRIVIAAVATAVVAVPKGLPSVFTLRIAYSMKRMKADQAMIKKLSACETMGFVKTICVHKATLTLNQMQVTKFWFGQECFEEKSSISVIEPNVLELFNQGVGLNTTGSILVPVSSSEPEFAGSPTEKAILSWARLDLGLDVEKLKHDYEVLGVETFNSEKKRRGVLVRKNADRAVYVHWKGDAEMVLEKCSCYSDSTGTIKFLNEDEDARSRIKNIIEGMAASGLECIAFAYRQILEEIAYNDHNVTQSRLREDGLTLLGMVGLRDPCRQGVKQAVEDCKSAGVAVMLITGDNVFTAKAIAAECGILEPRDQEIDGEVVEGVEFRNHTQDQRMKKSESIRVMARSSPRDKLLMVQCLKENGHVVAATGDNIEDVPTLHEADIGLSMGIQGTELAKKSSDVIVLDDDFATIVKVVKWGRCVYSNIQKFIQFQLTVNVAALMINFFAAISLGKIPFTAFQLLWVDLIVNMLGASALATEPPKHDEVIYRVPVRQTEPLITSIMWRNVLAQSLYQITIILILHFMGKSIFHVASDVNSTMVFNTFVLCQVFNMFNSISMEKQNVFLEIHRNQLLMVIVGITIVLQVVMVEFLNKLANTRSLNWFQWLACFVIAAITLPIGWFVKSIHVSDRALDNLKNAIITSLIGIIISAIINVLFDLHKKYSN